MAYLDEDGNEQVDGTPRQPALGKKSAPTIQEQIRQLVRSERLRQEAEAAGQESFDEADDFDVGDDFDPSSPYEEVFDPPPDPREEADRSLSRLAEAIGEALHRHKPREPSRESTPPADSPPPVPASPPPEGGAQRPPTATSLPRFIKPRRD